MSRQAWDQKIVRLIQTLRTTGDIQIHDNGYRTHPGVLITDGIKGLFKGHEFSIWSDWPGEILLMHRALPRGAVELLCNQVKECWLALES